MGDFFTHTTKDDGIDESLHKQTIYLITGVSGFVGYQTALRLCDKGFIVRGLIRKDTGTVPYPESLQLIQGDVLDTDSLEGLFFGIDEKIYKTVLIHCAAYISVKTKDKYCERVNIQGTKNILELCKKHGARLVFMSSTDALSNPFDCALFEPEKHKSSYAKSKAAASKLVIDAIEQGLSAVILLPSAIAGPDDYRKGLIYDLLSIYLSGITWFGIKGGYDFVDVRDVADAAIAACENTREKCYILSNRYANVTDIYTMLSRYLKVTKPFINLPLWCLYGTIPFMRMWSHFKKRECPISANAIYILGQKPEYPNHYAKRDLGFNPGPLEKTFKDTVDFINMRTRRDKRQKKKGKD